MTFLNFKFWKQIGISDIQVSGLAFINGGKNPQASMGNLYSRSTGSTLIAIKSETAALQNNLISSSKLIKY